MYLFNLFKLTKGALVGAKFEILISKPHWDNNERIKKAFQSLATEYKNDSTIGNVFGKTLRGQYKKNDYIIESSNSRYPYASRIPFTEAVSLLIIYQCRRSKII